jgi:F-type H+-transporting ATPase subunit b
MIDLVLSESQFDIASNFGINTNLFETNLVNLSIVLIVLFYFGKGVLLDILETRKSKILLQIEDAKTQVNEAQSRLIQAEQDLALARNKVLTIQADAEILVEVKKRDLKESLSDKQKRLKEANNSIISFEKNKELTKLRYRVFNDALHHVKEYLNQSITNDLHLKINDYQLSTFNLMNK